jgi:hypothetical protein
MAPNLSLDSAESETLMASELQRGGYRLPDLEPADKKQMAALGAALSAGGGDAAGAGTAGSGLIIDGFIVPPHVLQALQELRVQSASAASAERAASSEGGDPQRPLPAPAGGQENVGPSGTEALPPGRAASLAGSLAGSSPCTPLSPGTAGSVPNSSPLGGTQFSGSSGRGGRASTAAGGSGSRGSSRSSGRHSAHSGGSGWSSASGRSGRSSGSGCGGGRHSSGSDGTETDEHVAGLEAVVAELTSRSSANVAVIARLTTDIASLSTTNEALRHRLVLLTSQLRHRDAEIDGLRSDVSRLRTLVASSPASTANRCSSRK